MGSWIFPEFLIPVAFPLSNQPLPHNDASGAIKPIVEEGAPAMATTYALPVMNGHGAGHHGHSHSRKSAGQRLPLQPTSVNQTLSYTDLLKPQMANQHQPLKSIDGHHEPGEEEVTPFPQLSSPHPSFSTPTYARTKSMERRKSAGLPTHLRLQGNGYGFPATTTQRFRSNTIEPGTK